MRFACLDPFIGDLGSWSPYSGLSTLSRVSVLPESALPLFGRLASFHVRPGRRMYCNPNPMKETRLRDTRVTRAQAQLWVKRSVAWVQES